MSQLVTTPDFVSTCACSAPPPASATPPQNPILYYNVALGSPAAQGIIPPNPGIPATIFEIAGAGPGYVWNPTKGVWN
jgi:hypothetical protein